MAGLQEFLSVFKVKTCKGNYVVNMPLAIILPTHSWLELLFQVGLQFLN